VASFYQKNKKTGLHPFRQIFWDLREDTMDLILVKKISIILTFII